jgi:hypothetical protein
MVQIILKRILATTLSSSLVGGDDVVFSVKDGVVHESHSF